MRSSIGLALSALSAALLYSPAASAQFLALNAPAEHPHAVFRQVMPAAHPAPEHESTAQSDEPAHQAPAHLRRQVVSYVGHEPSGTVVIDTANTHLYYVLGNGRAIRYGIGVGREGFTWSGVQPITRKAEWPDWYPPAEMIERQPHLPRMMAGGPGNPLGARAIYLGGTVYRIHGTNAPDTIGTRVSSGCIRLTNDDVKDLYERVNVGTRVVVLPIRPAVASGPGVRAATAGSSVAHRLY